MKPFGAVVLGVSAVIAAGSLALMTYRPDPSSNMPNLAREPRHPVTLKMESDAKSVAGEKAPEIDLPATGGNHLKLSEMLASGPVVVVMIKDGCPCSVEAQPFFNKLAENYEGKVQFLGVMDATENVASKYKDDFKVPFPIVRDEGMKTYVAFQSPQSGYFTLIGKDGVVRRLYPGYSKTTLVQFNQLLGAEVGIESPPIDVTMAPDKETSGCRFGEKAPQA